MDERTPADTSGQQRAATGDPDTGGAPGMSGQPRPPAMSARAAADALGVNERTVRRWIDQGAIAAIKVRGSYRIAAEEIERARVAVLGDGLGEIVEVHGRTEPDSPAEPDLPGASGHARRPDTPGRARTAAGAAPPAVSPAAFAQLAAIRDEWVLPLTARIEELAREAATAEERARQAIEERERERIDRERAEQERDRQRDGRAEAERERDALRAKVERMKAAQDAPVRPPEPPGRAELAKMAPGTPRSFWGRLRALLGGGG